MSRKNYGMCNAHYRQVCENLANRYRLSSDPTPGEIETDSLVGVFLHQILHQRNVVYLHEQVDGLGL